MPISIQGYRLSPDQRRLWPIAGVSQRRNIVLRFEGKLDEHRLGRALRFLMARHSMLRTSFEIVEGTSLPLQVVQDPFDASWEQVHLLRNDKGPVDHSAGFSSRLSQTGSEHFTLSLGAPMVCVDSQSLEILANELWLLYQDQELQPATVEYIQYAEWANELADSVLPSSVLESEQRGMAVEKWRYLWNEAANGSPIPFARLAGVPFASASSTMRGVETLQLEKLALELSAPREAILLASWVATLARLTQRSAYTVGVRYAGRDLQELTDAIGVFERILPIQVNISSRTTFVDLVYQLARGLEFNSDWNDVCPSAPLTLPQAVFDLRKSTVVWKSPQLRMRIEAADSNLEPFTTKLVCREHSHGVTAELAFNANVLAASDVQTLGDCWRLFLDAALQDSKQLVSLLPVLREADSVRSSSNDDQLQPGESCSHEIFERQAAETPDRISLVQDNQQLTYSALNRRSSALAHVLGLLPTLSEGCIAIFLNPSLDLCVAILAVWKAGLAYVPLDPAVPIPRLKLMLEDCSANAVVTTRELAYSLPSTVPHIYIEDVDALSPISLIPPVHPESLAYVIYTSGSSGSPKGVAVEHRQLAAYVDAVSKRIGFAPGSHFAMVSTPAADLGHTMMFPALLQGGTLHLLPRELVSNPEEFGGYMHSRRIENLKIVPTHLAALTSSMQPERILPLRKLVLGGEVLHRHLLHLIDGLAPDCTVFNHYGPTETTVGVVAGEASEYQETVPLGKPLAGVRIYILDHNLQLLPEGLPGEAFIGGDSLARGYFGLPDSTAASYLPDPFSKIRGARLYRSGDRVRMLSDGRIEYLGRLDAQVKIQGYRVEPAEIESIVRAVSGCSDAAVQLREDRAGEKRLVAYITPDHGLASDPEIRSRMVEILPAYMIPSAIVRLAKLPLTPNGKLDRHSLPLPGFDGQTSRSVFIAPGTVVETSLAGIWSRVLRVPEIGLTDNFFELGGDSILGIQIVARARQAGLQINTRQLFENPTILALAALVPENQTPALKELANPLGAVSLTPVQHRFFAGNDVDRHHYNQAFLLALPTGVNVDFLGQCIEIVVKHHDQLRARFQFEQHEWRQSVSAFENSGVFQTIDVSGEPNLADVIERSAAAWQTRFDLEKGPLFRALFFKTGGARPPRLLLLAHHLVVDGITWRILLEDIESSYHDLEGERRPRLVATSSYRDWAEALIRYANSDALRHELTYWRELEHQPPSQLRQHLASHYENEAGIGTLKGTLDVASTRMLLQELPAVQKASMQDALLSALVRAASNKTGSTHVSIELEGHGRVDIAPGLDVSRTAGWFTSHFPVIFSAKHRSNAADALAEVKEQLRALPNSGIGFDLFKYLRSERFQLPSMDISFNYLGQLDNLLPESKLFSPAPESIGPTRGPNARLPYLFVLTAHISAGALHFTWSYDRSVVSVPGIADLSAEFEKGLKEISQLCLKKTAVRYSPSDFPLARLRQPALDAILDGRSGLEDILPLTPMQQGMLFHSLLAPRDGSYFGQLSCDLDVALDLNAFQTAWQAVVDHFPVLRSSLAWDGLEVPVLMVWRHVTVPFEVVDWREISTVQQESRWTFLLQGNREQGFDFSKPPLMRILVVRLTATRNRLLWINHHLLQDGWCRPIILESFFAFYRSAVEGKVCTLPAAPPWRNYIGWLQQRDQQAANAFWAAELQGYRSPTPLGMQRADLPLERSAERRVTRQRLPADWTNAVLDSARENGLTLNTLVQGAWALLLGVYSGRKDIVFGATVSGRPAELDGAERMVGLFINTLPVRVRLNAADTVARWLLQHQQRQAAAREFEFSALVDIRVVSDVPAEKPLFESIVVFENYPIDEAVAQQSSVMQASNLQVSEPSNYQLGLVVVPGRELQLRIGYDPNRFDDRTMSHLAQELSDLLKEMAAGMKRAVGDLSVSAPKLTDPLEDLYSRSNLSRNQLLIWIDEGLRPGSRIYNGGYFYTIHGPIDPQRFRTAFQKLVDGSDILRSVIVETGGVPFRQVLPRMAGGLEVIDPSSWCDQIDSWLSERVRVPFRLEHRLFDSVLLKLAENTWGWFLNVHHIVSDAWSFQVLFRSMETLYGRALAGKLDLPFALPDYDQFVRQEKAAWKTANGQKSSRYWLQKLSQDVPPVAFWGERVQKKTASVERRQFLLGSARTKRLKELAHREDIFHKNLDISLYNIFATVVFAWLYRTTNSDWLSLGSPFHNRRDQRAKEMAGLFMQVLFLRVKVDANCTFLDILRTVVAETTEVMKHRDFTPGNSGSGPGKAYEVSLNYHNSSYPTFSSMQVSVDRAFSGEESDSIGIRVADFGKQGNLALHFDLHCDVFTLSQREEVMFGIVAMIDAFIQAPDTAINSLGLLRPNDECLALTFSESPKLQESLELVPARIERHARAEPEKIALIFGSQRVSYAELNLRSNQVAHYLLQQGIARDSIVGVFADRSLDSIIAVLGVWKAGAAYLPLNPRYPLARLRAMISDANASVVLVEGQSATHVAVDGVLLVSLKDNAITSCSDEAVNSRYDEDALAYLIYTSGSTGRPKGVMVSHRAFANACHFWQVSYELDRSNVHLQVASFSFDVFAGDLARSLGNGGTLVLCAEDVLVDGPSLYQYLSQNQVDTVEFTPALLRTLISSVEETGRRLDFLRILIAGSDTWSVEEHAGARQHCGPFTRLINSYGITEAVIDSTFYEGGQDQDGSADTVPIGRPFPGVKIYILDKSFHPVVPGIPGEIYIGGATLARGYSRMPGQTAEKFLCDPFAGESGARMYRTGDVGRWSSQGNLQLLGRIDQQVKVRGFRLELGEIESVLRRHSGVREAVVVSHAGAGSDVELKACIVAEKAPPSALGLRDFALQHLPEFMVPSSFAFFNEFPVTANGKVDRRALSSADAIKLAPENIYIEPNTSTEKQMAEIWRSVLKKERVGATDNFFLLGGHSLLATVLISRARTEFKVDLPLRAIFDSPTVAALSAIVDALKGHRSTTQQVEDALRYVESLDEGALNSMLQKSSVAQVGGGN